MRGEGLGVRGWGLGVEGQTQSSARMEFGVTWCTLMKTLGSLLMTPHGLSSGIVAFDLLGAGESYDLRFVRLRGKERYSTC